MFDYKKHYVFSTHKYIIDMIKTGVFIEDVRESCILWANKIDGHIVRYVDEHNGYCDGYLVNFDWCKEVGTYDM